MPNSRYYSSIAAATNLQVTANPSDTSIQVASSSGWPGSFPFIVSLDYGAANEELVLATSGGPNIFQVTRAYDGTPSSTHNAGAVVRHVSSAIDFTDSRSHEAASSSVHGITGQFVDTLSTQTMSNKTMSAPILNNPTIGGAAVATGATIANGTYNNPAITNPAISGGGSLAGTFSGTATLSGFISFTGGIQVLTNSALFQRALATDVTTRHSVTGDSNNRLQVTAGGTITWGPGNVTGDTILARSAANTLALTGNLTVSGTLSPATLGGNIAGNPAFTGQPTFTPVTITDAALVPDTVANGWSLDSAAGRKAGGVTTVRVNVQRVGGNIVASSSGNIPDTKIGTLAAGWRPLDGTMVSNYDMSGIAAGSISIGNDGIMTIKSLFANNTIGLADTVNFSLTFVSST